MSEVLNAIRKPEKIMAYRLSSGGIGTREEALADMRKQAIDKWLTKEGIFLDDDDTVGGFIAAHGEMILKMLTESAKVMD